jgi:hypothetical protein
VDWLYAASATGDERCVRQALFFAAEISYQTVMGSLATIGLPGLQEKAWAK